MKKQSNQGFTFIELIAAMSVMAILMGIGIPSFSNAIKNSQIGEKSRRVTESLYIARSEAIKRGTNVTVCARATDITCGNNWKNGWLVFTDSNPDPTQAIPDIAIDTDPSTADDDEILNMQPALEKHSLDSKGSANGTIAGIDDRYYVRYDSKGGTNWKNVSFILCDDRGTLEGRSVNIALTGDIRTGRVNTDTDTRTDVFNQDIVCGTLP